MVLKAKYEIKAFSEYFTLILVLYKITPNFISKILHLLYKILIVAFRFATLTPLHSSYFGFMLVPQANLYSDYYDLNIDSWLVAMLIWEVTMARGFI